MKRLNISSHVFGRLTAISIACPLVMGKVTHSRWHCMCSCGNKTIVETQKLRSGHTRSCGCLLVDVLKAVKRTHGHTVGKSTTGKTSPEYQSWSSAKDRCVNPRNKAWKNYGGRGITMAQEWQDDFLAFYAELGKRPKGTTLDRIEVNKGYEPGNCRWATRKEQSRNMRKTIFVQYEGRSVKVADLADSLGIDYHTAYKRISNGKGIKESNRLSFNGRSLKTIAAERGISYYTVRAAFRRGLDPEEFNPRQRHQS